MISASNFAAGIILVRGLGLADFGKYSIAYVLLLYANSLQLSFVASPMLSLAPLMAEEERRLFVDGMLAIQLFASAALLIVFALVGGVARIFTPFFSLPVVFAFACCVGTFQLQDWLRRYYFLCNKARLAIVSDFISYFVQLLILFLLWRAHELNLFRTFIVMCATSVAAVAMGPITDRLRPEIGRLRATWVHCKALSSGLALSIQVRWLGSQGVFLIATAILGTTTAGGLRASQYIAGPLYLFLLSSENVIPIRIAEELRKNGPAGAHAFTVRIITIAVAAAVGIIAPIAFFGRSILAFIYGPAVAVFYLPMVLTLVYTVLQGTTTMWFYLYRGVKDSRAIVTATAISAIGSVATVYWFGHLWNATGIVLSTMLGQVVTFAYCMLHWRASRDKFLLNQEFPKSPDNNGAVVVS
jgi:O-antigen/teichoic acid export membrane protein